MGHLTSRKSVPQYTTLFIVYSYSELLVMFFAMRLKVTVKNMNSFIMAHIFIEETIQCNGVRSLMALL